MSCLQSCQMAKVLKKVKREKGESLMTNGIGKYVKQIALTELES